MTMSTPVITKIKKNGSVLQIRETLSQEFLTANNLKLNDLVKMYLEKVDDGQKTKRDKTTR